MPVDVAVECEHAPAVPEQQSESRLQYPFDGAQVHRFLSPQMPEQQSSGPLQVGTVVAAMEAQQSTPPSPTSGSLVLPVVDVLVRQAVTGKASDMTTLSSFEEICIGSAPYFCGLQTVGGGMGLVGSSGLPPVPPGVVVSPHGGAVWSPPGKFGSSENVTDAPVEVASSPTHWFASVMS